MMRVRGLGFSSLSASPHDRNLFSPDAIRVRAYTADTTAKVLFYVSSFDFFFMFSTGRPRRRRRGRFDTIIFLFALDRLCRRRTSRVPHCFRVFLCTTLCVYTYADKTRLRIPFEVHLSAAARVVDCGAKNE